MLGPLFCHPFRFRAFLPFAYRGSSFSLSYGCNLPSSLTRVFPRTLGFSPRLPVSVYGTGGYVLARSFSWQCGIHEFVKVAFNSPSCLCFQVRGFASSPTYSLGRALPVARSCALLRRSIAGNGHIRYRNFNLLSIAYASSPRLRSRLTLSRRSLLRNPRAFGGKDSHLSFRYSYRHSHFLYVHISLR